MANITDQQIADAAATPAAISVDGVSITNRSTQELLDAQDGLAQSNASSPRRGLLLSRLIPGSAVGPRSNRGY